MTGLMYTHVIVVTLMYVYICICTHAQLLQLLVYSHLHDNEHSVTLLKDHYGQPQKLITAHMQALLDLPNPTNTLSSLQSFHDAKERHMRSLSTLGKSVDSYGDLLVSIILNKLPQKIRKNMVREHDSNE